MVTGGCFYLLLVSMKIMVQFLVSSTTPDCEPIGEFHSCRRVTKVRHLILLACNVVCDHWSVFSTNLEPAFSTFDYHCTILLSSATPWDWELLHEFHLGKWCCLTWPYHQGAVNTDRQWSTSWIMPISISVGECYLFRRARAIWIRVQYNHWLLTQHLDVFLIQDAEDSVQSTQAKTRQREEKEIGLECKISMLALYEFVLSTIQVLTLTPRCAGVSG